MSEDKAVIALRSYVADYSSEDGMFQPKHYAREFQRVLADLDSKPTPTRIEFRMMGPKLAFSIGNQCFTLDHEPDSDDEAEVMQRMLCHALSGFAPDVKTSGADAQPATEQAMPVDRQAAFEAWLENYPIQIVEDDYELCFDAFYAGMKAAQITVEQATGLLGECRAALMECDRDCDYALIERIDALDSPQSASGTSATQPARAPLTEEQIDDMLADANRGFCIERDDYIKAVRDTERAHGIGEAGNA
jgi:hypothetical protein